MGITKIQWANLTVNFWSGCTKQSPGCRFCYMYRDKERYGLDPKVVVPVSDSTINSTLKLGKPGDRVFTCSWSDFFIKDADQWRAKAWDTIRANPQYNWLILTKHPDRIAECLPGDWGPEGWSHVWLGVSVESPDYLFRVDQLAAIPAKVHFVSYEPALEPINLNPYLEEKKIDWVICGGESGNDVGKYLYRPSAVSWYQNVVDQCKFYGVSVFVKQLGTHLSKKLNLTDRHGGDIQEFPTGLQIREFPLTKN